MADAYIDLGITADAPTLLEDGVDAIRSLAGDTAWSPSPIEEWLLSAVARIGVEIAILAGRIPAQAIFTFFGQTLVGIPIDEATSATGTVTVTVIDTNGPYTIEAGAQIDIDDQPFTTDADLTINNGETTGSVGVTAATPGTAGSGLTGTTVELISPTYVFVDTVTLDAITTGGLDAETLDDYADKLAGELPTLSPKAILIDDFAAIARRDPEVFRALAIDNFVPPSTTGVAGAVTVALQNTAGEAVSSDAKTRVETALEARRVLAIDVHVIDPTLTPVVVVFTATAQDGWDPASVQADAITALGAFLNAAGWGRPANGASTEWVDEPTLYVKDLIGVLYSVPGLRHVLTLTLARARILTGDAATDIETSTAHGYSDTDPIAFVDLAGGAPLTDGTTYYARDTTTNTFKVAATSGGAAIDITTDITGGYVYAVGLTADLALDTPAAIPQPIEITGTVT